ncbi:MAG: InlB B-repeat-containing protein [Clostridiales bacterium]|nr:InlB B-repeat-containing protein [Clostridiales bacterium]
MTKTKKIVAMLVVVALMFSLVATIAACATHTCEHVCEVCHKCQDADCQDSVCAEKCEGHQQGGGHVCGHKCEVCGKCTSECTDAVCAEKCEGHQQGGEHVCGHKCEVCGKCTSECTDAACAEKCEGHQQGGDHTCEHECEECGKCTSECEDAACAEKCPGHGGEEPAEFTITFEVGDDGSFTDAEFAGTMTTVNGKLASLPEVTTSRELTTFLGWFTEATEGDQITLETVFTTEDDSTEITVYAQYHKEFRITLNIDSSKGALKPEDAEKTEFITVNGMIDGYLPEPTCSVAHWHFDNWYDGETGIDEEVTVFTKDTELVAVFVRDNGVWSGEDADLFRIALVKNSGATGVIAEYWFGGASTKISVTEGERLSLYLNGVRIAHYAGGAVGVEGNKSSSQKSDYVTVTVTGELQLYLKLYSHATDPNNYVCEWLGATKVETGSEVPEGCDPVTITFTYTPAGGEPVVSVVTIYLVDNTGKAVGEADFSKFCIYTYNGEAFGAWGTSTTKGKLQSQMSASVDLPSGWIFRWGSSYSQQTANIVDVFKAGKTYLVKLPSATQGTAEVTELTLPAEE